jgi:aspartate ammonia-lyase
MRSFNARCASGIEPNAKRIKEHLDNSLMLVTALNPHLGYEKAAQISLLAYREDLSLKDAVLKLGFLTAEQFDKWVRPADMTHPLASWSLRAAKSFCLSNASSAIARRLISASYARLRRTPPGRPG